MSDASKIDLRQFSLWYGRAGTPIVNYESDYDSASAKFTLKLTQKSSEPLHIPIAIGLLDSKGNDILSDIINLKKETEEIVFDLNIIEKPVLSFNRNFSAPIISETEQTYEELMFLFKNDSDFFNRWDCGQKLAKQSLIGGVNSIIKHEAYIPESNFIDVFGNLLLDSNIDNSFKSLSLVLPSEALLLQEFEVIDFEAIHKARELLKTAIAKSNYDKFEKQYLALKENIPYAPEMSQISKRDLRIRCLEYMVQAGSLDAVKLCKQHFENSDNMTDSFGSLMILANTEEAEQCLSMFKYKWKNDVRVINKYFTIVASSKHNTFEKVKLLEKDPLFQIKIPNMIRALYMNFIKNLALFHDNTYEPYNFISDRIIEIDKFNPSMSSSLASAFKYYARCDDKRKAAMKLNMERIISQKDISKNAYEIIQKTLEHDGV